MHVLLSFLKWGSIGYSLRIVQWDFTRRDPGNPGRVSGSGPVTQCVFPHHPKFSNSFMFSFGFHSFKFSPFQTFKNTNFGSHFSSFIT